MALPEAACMIFLAAILPILASAAQASEPITVTAYPWAPFISPMGEPFRARTRGEDTFARWFHQADSNQDGTLTADEMRADAERFFARLDSDRDGRIGSEERMAYEAFRAPPDTACSISPNRFQPPMRTSIESSRWTNSEAPHCTDFNCWTAIGSAKSCWRV